MHSYIDLFIRKLEEQGQNEDGVNFQDVSGLFILPSFCIHVK
jgi:hypothetical protein